MSSLVKCSVDNLQLGRLLANPIYSYGGVLLLSAGNEITPEHVRKLKARGISSVIMDASDASGAEPEAPTEGSSENRGTDNLKELLSGAGYCIRNNGPPVRNSIQKHGRKSYSSSFQTKLLVQQQESREACDQLFKDIHSSKEIDGNHLKDISATQLALLTQDLESTLSVAFDPSQRSGVIEDSVNSAVLAMGIAIEMGMDFSNAHTVGTAGCLVNVGMSSTPKGTCSIQNTLTLTQQLELQKVPGRSLDLLEKVSNIPDIVRIVVYQAHERMDGSGYPRGLTGNKIHVFARTLQVATEYQRLLKGDSQTPAMSPYRAMETLLRMAHERKLDAEIVRRMLYLVSLYPIGSVVHLSDGSTGSVLRANGEHYTQPVVQRTFNARGHALDEDESNVVDLLESNLTVRQVADATTTAAIAGPNAA